MGASGAACKVAVAVEAGRRSKNGLLSAVDDLHTERTHPDVSMVVVDG